jgi:hypothetical protein
MERKLRAEDGETKRDLIPTTGATTAEARKATGDAKYPLDVATQFLIVRILKN